MDFETAYYTDPGTQKEVNQDSGCVMIADTPDGPVCMAFLCDGMGGISMGEYASAKVVLTFVDWFENVLPERLPQMSSLEEIARSWTDILIGLDVKFREYGKANGLKLGTTATGMLFWKNKYLLIQSGDSRAYKIGRTSRQLSEDQSYVQQQVNMGMMSVEEAKHHPKRNVLLNCIGGSRPSVPEWKIDRMGRKNNYLLCSDGFVHEISNQELTYFLSPRSGNDVEEIRDNLKKMIEAVKLRGESDNITALVIRAFSSKTRYSEKGFYFHVRQKIIITEGDMPPWNATAMTETEE